MAVEQLITRAFRAVPEGLRQRIVGGWVNESSVLRRLGEEFAAATNFNLAPVKQDEILGVLEGEKDGYLITKQDKHKLINIHFSISAIKQRQDLVEKKDGIGFYRLAGYLVFSKIASSLFLSKGLRVLPLWIKVKGYETHLIAFDVPLQSFTLQSYGFEDPRAFLDSQLLLYNTEDKADRFRIRFLPENSPLNQ